MDKRRVVVLGAGFGGLRAAMDIARRLRRHGLLPKYEVILIDRNDCHVFIPLLYRIAGSRDGLKRAHCTYNISFLVRHLPLRFLRDEIIGIDFEGGVVRLKNNPEIKASHLVVALGSETNYFDILGIQEFGAELKTLESALHVQSSVAAAMDRGGEVRIVVGGAGPNGIELAAEIKKWAAREERMRAGLKVSVIVIEAMPTVLPGFDPKIGAIAAARLQKLGIEVKLSAKISAISPAEIAIANDGQIPFAVFIWTGGTKTPKLLGDIPLQKESRGRPVAGEGMRCIPGTPDLRLLPSIYAIGDNVCFYNPETGKPVPAVARVAILEGEIAAHNIIEEIRAAEYPAHHPQFLQFVPKEYPYVIPIGGSWAVAKIGPFILGGWLAWQFNRLVELHYLMSIMPLSGAFSTWLRLEK